MMSSLDIFDPVWNRTSAIAIRHEDGESVSGSADHVRFHILEHEGMWDCSVMEGEQRIGLPAIQTGVVEVGDDSAERDCFILDDPSDPLERVTLRACRFRPYLHDDMMGCVSGVDYKGMWRRIDGVPARSFEHGWVCVESHMEVDSEIEGE